MPIQAIYWLNPSKFILVVRLPQDVINSQSDRTFGQHLKSFSSIITRVFIILLVTNLIGLIPYSFSMSSQLIMTLVLGLPI